QSHEYKNILVCTMAVLGCSKNGWYIYDNYLLILSSVIKIARFFVVQKAL
ncbi:putative telomere-associated RecQ helicase, partial [Aspergillus ibericus CBS 121593]